MERKQEELNDKIRSMALFAEYNPAPVFRFNHKGIISQANPAANSIFEFESIEGKEINNLLKGLNDIDIDQYIKTARISTIIEEIGDRIFRLEMRGIPQYGVCQVYGADITEIQYTKRENQRLSIAIEQSSSLIQVTDTKGNIIFVNKAFEEITGYSKEEIIGKNPKVLKTDHLSDTIYKDLWQTISSGKVWKGEFHNRKKNGNTYWEKATISPVKDEQGNIINYIAVKEDITEKKNAEKEIKSMALFARLNPEPVFRFNRKRIVLQSNPAANNIFQKQDIVHEKIDHLLPELETIDTEKLIDENEIITLTHHIGESIFRFIIRGISELKICQIYGSDITERVKAAERIRQQKEEIEEQHDEIKTQRDYIAEQNSRITDSIQYASRIQDAILPTQESIKKLLPEHFIFFKPRDIVSGDFYWSTYKDGKIIIVASDCTGHGVPGAFMSMLGVSFLNEIVNRNPVTTADIILNKLRDYVKTTLSQTGKERETKDGMDLSLCIIDKQKKELQFAGAYNSLLHFQEGNMLETKADKMPIGIHILEDKPFTNHTIQISKGDTFYMFSDGYQDQTGGEKRRKFMRKPFKRFLNEIHKQPMSDQKEALDKKLKVWKGSFEQIDDILVVGFRI